MSAWTDICVLTALKLWPYTARRVGALWSNFPTRSSTWATATPTPTTRRLFSPEKSKARFVCLEVLLLAVTWVFTVTLFVSHSRVQSERGCTRTKIIPSGRSCELCEPSRGFLDRFTFCMINMNVSSPKWHFPRQMCTWNIWQKHIITLVSLLSSFRWRSDSDCRLILQHH